MGGGGARKKGPIGQEIKCAVSQWRRRCHSHVSQVIAYCLLSSEKVRGRGDHIYFPSHPLAPFFSEHKEEQRATTAAEGEGWGVRLEGELVAAAAAASEAVAVEEVVVGSGIRKKKNIERESSDQTALIRRGGRGGVLLGAVGGGGVVGGREEGVGVGGVVVGGGWGGSAPGGRCVC